MPTLLHLDSSPMGDYSVSRHMSATFVEQWKKANPDGKVVTRDLYKTPLKPLEAAWVGAAYTPADKLTPEQKSVLALSGELTGELLSADEYVFGVPMWNFSVPGIFKLWIDQIVRVGITFTYADGAPKGLINGKKATFLLATGGEYGPGAPAASLNFVEPYLKGVFGFLGLQDVTFHTAGNASSLMRGADRNEFFKPHDEAVAALATA